MGVDIHLDINGPGMPGCIPGQRGIEPGLLFSGGLFPGEV